MFLLMVGIVVVVFYPIVLDVVYPRHPPTGPTIDTLLPLEIVLS